MDKPILNFTASKIALAERSNNANFFDALSSLAEKPSMQGLLFLFNAGGGTNEQFDQLFADGGLQAVMTAILDGLGAGGFLPKDAVEQAKAALADASTAPSPNTGSKDKK